MAGTNDRVAEIEGLFERNDTVGNGDIDFAEVVASCEVRGTLQDSFADPSWKAPDLRSDAFS
jgi:hypothetical protein